MTIHHAVEIRARKRPSPSASTAVSLSNSVPPSVRIGEVAVSVIGAALPSAFS